VTASATAPPPDAADDGAAADRVPATMRGRRRALIWTLIVLASLIGLGSILTTWVHRQMLDNQSWKDASAQLIQNPQVQEAVSVFLVSELYDNVDVASGLEQRLPDNLKPLASSLAGALRAPATDGVQRLLEGPRVQQLWVNANAAAQQKLVNVLENKTGHGISTGNGVVTLDLSQLVTEIGTELGVPDSALAKIPPDTGVITVMRSDQLSAAQSAVQAVRVLSTGLLVLVLAMYALAIYLAHGERRQTVRNIGFAFVLVGLAVLVLRTVAGNYAVDALTSPAGEHAGREAWLIGSAILSQIGWATILYGIIAVAGAILAGPTAAATAVRRRIAPVLNERPGVAWAGVAAVFLLLILWGGTHALRTGWGIVLLGALIAIGVAALRRQTLREFPGGEADEAVPSPPAPEPVVRQYTPGPSPAEEIARLGELRSAGSITDAEFERAKQKALA
jgi:putative oligomerization/nucleic acid binding protein